MTDRRHKPPSDEDIAEARYGGLTAAILAEGGMETLPDGDGPGEAKPAWAGTPLVHLREEEGRYTLCGLAVAETTNPTRGRCRTCKKVARIRGLEVPPMWRKGPR